MSNLDPAVKAEMQLFYGGISAVELTAIIQLLQLPALSWQLKIALYCFSINLPLSMLIFLYFALREAIPIEKRVDDFVGNLIKLLSLIISLGFILGFIFIWFHLNLIAGIIFSVSCFISIMCWFTVIHK